MSARLLGFVLVFLLAGAARAELQVFQGNFSLTGIVQSEPVTAIGVADVGVSGVADVDSLQIPGGLFELHTTITITGGTLPLSEVRVDVTLGPGNLAGGGAGTLAGPLPAPGTARLCILFDCLIFADVPFTEGGTRGVGIGGPPIVRDIGALGTLTLTGATWQTGQVIVPTSVSGSIAFTGFAHGPLSETSTAAAPLGLLQLVTPVAVTANTTSGIFVLPVFGVLQVKLLPEPGALVSLGAGALLLFVLAARRARR